MGGNNAFAMSQMNQGQLSQLNQSQLNQLSQGAAAMHNFSNMVPAFPAL